MSLSLLELAHGVQKDFKEAARLYRLAASQGNSDAQMNLGECYEDGQGVNKDLKEAVFFYRLAANQGNPQARMKLALFYYKGIVVKKDLNEARQMLLS